MNTAALNLAGLNVRQVSEDTLAAWLRTGDADLVRLAHAERGRRFAATSSTAQQRTHAEVRASLRRPPTSRPRASAPTTSKRITDADLDALRAYFGR